MVRLPKYNPSWLLVFRETQFAQATSSHPRRGSVGSVPAGRERRRGGIHAGRHVPSHWHYRRCGGESLESSSKVGNKCEF